MILYINYNLKAICEKVLQEQLNKLELNYSLLSFNEIEIKETLSADKLKQLNAGLNKYSIEIVENQKSILVQKIKDAIIEIVYMDEKLPTIKTSTYLSDKLNHSYNYLLDLFSAVTYTSIENFIILQKIERAKQLMTFNELNISEIGRKLNYSSTAHFSHQFKSVTGLTPTAFQRIITKRRIPNKEEQKNT